MFSGPPICWLGGVFAVAADKKKTELLRVTDNDDKMKKSQRVIGRLEKDLADATKELQTQATPSKMIVAVFVMVVMISVQKRCETGSWAGRQAGSRTLRDGGVVGHGVALACLVVLYGVHVTASAKLSFLLV